MTEDYQLSYTETDIDLTQSLKAPGKGYWILLTFLFLLICTGGYAWGVQIANGIGEAGKNNPVGWAMYIATFVFWVGIAHSGTSSLLFYSCSASNGVLLFTAALKRLRFSDWQLQDCFHSSISEEYG